jgi:hypothetical protein
VLQQVPTSPAADCVWSQAELDQGACLQQLQHQRLVAHAVPLTRLQLRHITANGLVPLASADQLEGLAACMQTRCAARAAARARAPRADARPQRAQAHHCVPRQPP